MKKNLQNAFGIDEYGFLNISKISGVNYIRIEDVLLRCNRCCLRRGCNYKRHSDDRRSWKNYRNTQYK